MEDKLGAQLNPPNLQNTQSNHPSVREILRTYINGDNGRNVGPIEATQALKALVTEMVNEIIGEDEKHDNGHKMFNDPSMCMDCTNPDERFAHNQLRAEQRQRAKAEIERRFGDE